MVAAPDDLQHLPDWPRLLSREQAAAYCGMSPPFFAAMVPVKPIRLRRVGSSEKGGRVLYDRRELDAWIDGLRGATPAGDWTEAFG